ncbi:MAG TPA: hypothetical protein VG738_13745 [Chitinophagaceae bacterium]|nr:hypothetical protein [Chitinophagaceae bacterium]
MDKTVSKIGFWSALIAFSATTAFVIVQLLQLVGVLTFPADEIAIFTTSLCIVIPFILAMLALHYVTPAEKKFWSHGALLFTVMYAVFVTANYVVQLATVIPVKLKGAAGDMGMLEQTPHSLFWDFDALGYIFMGLAMLMALPVFERRRFQNRVRLSFLANGLVTPLIAFVYFYPGYSAGILMIGLPWAVTAPLAMLLLAIMFKKHYRATPPGPAI